MQQKANEVHLYLEGQSILLTDVKIIETEDGIYVEDTVKLGTSDEGEDIIQKRLTYYKRDNLSKIVWKEDNLVESVKESVLTEMIQDKFEHLMDMYEEEEGDQPVISGREKRDDPSFDPYGSKED